MEILYLDCIDSTQKYLISKLKANKIKPPYAVSSLTQSDGVGSRDNKWIGYKGNLFVSFALDINSLPFDLKIQSSSIYFAYILKRLLSDLGSSVILKWPNDFYIENKKIGGVITSKVSNTLVCGIGLNLIKSNSDSDILDIDISKEIILKNYFIALEKKPLWKEIFSNYLLEFPINKRFNFNDNGVKISLKDAKLQEDGSIIVNEKVVYSLR